MSLLSKVKTSRMTVAILAVCVLVLVLGGALAFANDLNPVNDVGAVDTEIGGSVSVTWTVPAIATRPDSWQVEYKLGAGGVWTAYDTVLASTITTTAATSTTCTVSGLTNDSAYYFQVREYNSASSYGDWGFSNVATPTDSTDPVTTLIFSDPTSNTAGWFNSKPTYGFYPNEAGCITYAATGSVEATAGQMNAVTSGSQITSVTAGYLWAIDGTSTLTYFSVDNASTPNTETTKTVIYKLDSTVPTEAMAAAASPSGIADWYTTNTTLTITPYDAGGSGPKTVSYRWGSEAFTNVTTSTAVALPAALRAGSNVFEWKVTDIADNVSAVATRSLKFDSVLPSTIATPTAVTIPEGKARVTWTASADAHSGVSTYTVGWSTSSTFTASAAASGSVDVTSGVLTSDVDCSSALPTATPIYFRVKAADAAGNAGVWSGIVSSAYAADDEVPAISWTPSGSTWTTSSQICTVVVTDVGSGLDYFKYRYYLTSVTTPTAAWTTVSSAATAVIAVPEGAYTLAVTAYDNVSNETSETKPFEWDATAPVTSLSMDPTGPLGGGGTWSTTTTVSFLVDDVSGAEATTTCWWDSGSSASGTSTVGASTAGTSSVTTMTPSATGTYTLSYFSTDFAGNQEATQTQVFLMDLDQPAVAFDPVEAASTWKTVSGVVTLTATASNPSTIGATHYQIDSVAGSWTTAATATVAVPFNLEGTHTVYAYAEDVNGRTGAVYSWIYLLDTVDPVIGATTPAYVNDRYGVVTFAIGDLTSGVATAVAWRSGEDPAVVSSFNATTGILTYTPTLPLIDGENLIQILARDVAGNPTLAANGYRFVTYTEGTTYTPVEGATRYDTAIAASLEAFPSGLTTDTEGYKTVVLATGENFPDALGGAALAGALDGPILLTNTSALPSTVASEVARLGATRVIIVGGTGAVSADVAVAALALSTVTEVERIGGADRYETARLVAARTVGVLGASATTAFVATGDNFPDALAASPLAASGGIPLYLARSTGLDAATVASMTADGITDAVILGGTGAVPASVETDLGSIDSTRLAGADRYATAVEIAEYGVSTLSLSWDGVGIATGMNFPDALAGGVMLGRNGSVLLLTKTDSLPAVVSAAITANASVIDTVYYLGGTGAVSQAVRDAVSALLP